MDNIVINPHSLVDVITNSSSVIYTGVKYNAVEVVEDIINEVLKHAGSTMTAKDLFTVEVETLDEEEADWEEIDRFHDQEPQIKVDVNEESGVYTDNRIVVTSINYPDTTISDKLAQIFFAEERYG